MREKFGHALVVLFSLRAIFGDFLRLGGSFNVKVEPCVVDFMTQLHFCVKLAWFLLFVIFERGVLWQL